jgi:hypothetical protein
VDADDVSRDETRPRFCDPRGCFSSRRISFVISGFTPLRCVDLTTYCGVCEAPIAVLFMSMQWYCIFNKTAQQECKVDCFRHHLGGGPAERFCQ